MLETYILEKIPKINKILHSTENILILIIKLCSLQLVVHSDITEIMSVNVKSQAHDTRCVLQFQNLGFIFNLAYFMMDDDIPLQI